MKVPALRIFGVYHYPAVTCYDFGTRRIELDAYHMQKILPGFRLGASYGSYPLSKVLERANANFKIRTIVRQDNTWTYTFGHTETGTTFYFVATRREANVKDARQRPPIPTGR